MQQKLFTTSGKEISFSLFQICLSKVCDPIEKGTQVTKKNNAPIKKLTSQLNNQYSPDILKFETVQITKTQ